MIYKHILVLGATGATGHLVVQMALDRGHRVTALVRDAAGIKQQGGLEIVQGDVLDAAALDRVMKGKQAVVSCLGINRKNAASPFTQLLSADNFSAESGAMIVAAMINHGVKRVVALSAAGAGESWDRVDGPSRFLFRISKLAITLRDSGNMEEVYKNSGLDSLAVQPVRLIDGPATGCSKLLERAKVSGKISRGDVAAWMLDALERPEPFEHRSEMIGWG